MNGSADAKTPAAEKEDPQGLVLRGRPKRAVRLRRGLIVGGIGLACSAVAAISWLALEPPAAARLASPIESDEPAARAEEDTLADMPRSYADVPRLGPPLPGDLGRPILEHERALGELVPHPRVDPGMAEARVRAASEAGRERLAEARSSPVIVQLAGPAAVSPAPSSEGAGEAVSASVSPSDTRTDPHRIEPPASPWTVTAGTVIPASLLTGLDSDLPGTVIAQVTENVRDSATGRTILIPQGARLIGTYESASAYGQRRAFLVWSRIVLPDGSSVALDHMPAADASGYAGVSDRVDSHSWRLLKGIALSTLLGVGTQLGLGGGGSELVRAIRESGERNAGDSGDMITSRNLDVKPTIRVRPGWPVQAIVNKDLVLQPWRG